MPKTAIKPRKSSPTPPPVVSVDPGPSSPDATAKAGQIRRRLLAWYDPNHRKLAWRAEPGETLNPYHVLVSEAMLQQTQVATVIPYFDRFIKALPTLRKLADADEQIVLRLWQGLGYYRRARNLHAAAKQIVQDHKGKVPDNVTDLLALPGVGRYTAGAIASIAYNKPTPILDGNVARVFSRLFLIDTPIDIPATTKTLWRLAEELVPTKRPGDFNQAVMELGALVCTKANPTCDTCPLAKTCAALSADRVDEVPVPAKRKAPKAVHHHIIAIKRGNRYLFEQRPASGLWSNMWQLPTAEQLPARIDGQEISGWANERVGLTTDEVKPVGTFTHKTTHRTIHFKLWQADVIAGRLKPRAGQWRRLSQINDLPMANPQRKAISMLT